MAYPQIIQGGMGVAVSAWPLARAVSLTGQMGVVSGTALDVVLARRLQLGDPTGVLREAFAHFPVPEMAQRVWDRYFRAEGKPEEKPFVSKPMPSAQPSRALVELTVVANFVEVFLAKHGHNGVVGINLLEKIQVPTIPSLFGAMLAKVDYVLMGAGIPRAIPGILDRLSQMLPARLKVDVAGALPGEEYATEFDPKEYAPADLQELPRPKFLAIITSATLATTLSRRTPNPVDGFVVEGATAGGHNAPPRGAMQLSEIGEPIYGERDVPDLAAIAEIGLPFWVAGSYADPAKLVEARAAGAQGIQVGTAFAFCEESGIDPELKRQVLEKSARGEVRVFTDPLASPTGFPFKVLGLEGTMSQATEYAQRDRICDLGYLRQLYRKEDGTLGYRCAAEPIEDFEKKGGSFAETQGRKCVCNGLMATIGLGQRRKDGTAELPLITAGDDVANVARFLKPGQTSYRAADVVRHLLGE